MLASFTDVLISSLILVFRPYREAYYEIRISFDGFNHKFIYEPHDINYPLLRWHIYEWIIYHVFTHEACHRFEEDNDLKMTSGVAKDMATYAVDLIKHLEEENL